MPCAQSRCEGATVLSYMLRPCLSVLPSLELTQRSGAQLFKSQQRYITFQPTSLSTAHPHPSRGSCSLALPYFHPCAVWLSAVPGCAQLGRRCKLLRPLSFPTTHRGVRSHLPKADVPEDETVRL